MTKATLSRPRCHLQLETLEDRLAPSADMVIQWNDVMRDAVRTAGTAATSATRIMAITQAAVYDSVNALDRTHEVLPGRRPGPPEGVAGSGRRGGGAPGPDRLVPGPGRARSTPS